MRVYCCCWKEGDGEDDGEGMLLSETRACHHHHPCCLVNLVLLLSFKLALSIVSIMAQNACQRANYLQSMFPLMFLQCILHPYYLVEVPLQPVPAIDMAVC